MEESEWKVIRVRASLRSRLTALADMWTTKTSHKFSVPNVVEILAALGPGKITQEEVEGFKMESRPRGRPKHNRPQAIMGTCKSCQAEMVLKGCIVEWIGPHTYGVCSHECGVSLRLAFKKAQSTESNR